MRMILSRILPGALAALMVSFAAAAEPLPAPKGTPILTVTGKIGTTNDGTAAQFDRDMLEQIGTVSFETATPWHKGVVRFEGVPLAKVLDRVGAQGASLVAVALNDYSVELPASDARDFPVVLALKQDGAYLPVTDKGPLFIVYDYDSVDGLASPKFYSRSVWQLRSLEVR